MEALGALGGMVKVGSLGQKENVRINYKPEEIYSSKSRWRLVKGTNGIYLSTAGYLSRGRIQNNLIAYGLIAAKPEDSMEHGFL